MTHLPLAIRFARWVPVCVWTVLLMQGCAITAPATAWRPAEIDVSGMQRLSVLQFSGEGGRAVSAALTNCLWENEFYALVDSTDLIPIRVASASGAAGGVQPADYLDSARGHDVDGLIVGDIIEYRCDDQVLNSTDVHVGSSHGENKRRGVEHSGVDVDVSRNQTIQREATVSVAFRLVEVETGNVRASRKTTHHYQAQSTPSGQPLPTRGEVLDELTQQCIDQFIAMLAPHEVTLRLPLARASLFQRGQALVSKGNDFARRRRWEEATAAWQQALDINPTNDAARYNLAVAHAARQEYTQAEEQAIQAMNLKHRDLYADGLEQIRNLAADYERTMSQRKNVGNR